ncbi:MAG: hypothetical protein AAGF84_04845 [Planctomycetota bacterium]
MSDPLPESRASFPLFWKVVVAGFVILMAVILFLPSLGTGSHPSSKSMRSMLHMRQIQIAAYSYSVDHDNQWPDSFDRFSNDYLAGANEGERSVFINPRDGYLTYRLVHPGLSLDELEDPTNTPVLYEVKIDGTIDPNGIIGYADGHVAWSPGRYSD